MAEESGKGIALVILGIVAIIAIVGLVLLFTGARKNAAVGEFAVPAAKEYGGSIHGIADPYSRTFSGRALETSSGAVEHHEAAAESGGAVVRHGETPSPRAVQSSPHTYERGIHQVHALHTTCEGIASLPVNVNSPLRLYTEPASANEAVTYMQQGRDCKDVIDFASVAYQSNGLALDDEAYGHYDSLGVKICCTPPTLG